MVVIADGIIECRLGAFNPTSFQDRYQDAPRELVSCGRRTVQIHHLMYALKRSLAQGAEPEAKTAASRPTRNAVPVSGSRSKGKRLV